VPKTCNEIKDNLSAKHITVSICGLCFKYHTTKVSMVTEGKHNSACCHVVFQPVVLGLIYASPQILDNFTYVLPYMEKIVHLVTSSFTIIHQFMLSITIHFAQKLNYHYFSFYCIPIRTFRQFEHFHFPWYITVYWNAKYGQWNFVDLKATWKQ
jgi:hypothetical protein